MSEIKPTPEHLSDPYVLQLIEALTRRDDEIERLTAEIGRLKKIEVAAARYVLAVAESAPQFSELADALGVKKSLPTKD